MLNRRADNLFHQTVNFLEYSPYNAVINSRTAENAFVSQERITLNPFNLKAALLARHAQHVVLIHFPIALFMTAVLFDVMAYSTKRKALADAAYYNLLLAALSTIPTIATGVLAWQFQLEGQKLKGILLLHLVLAGVSSAMIWLTWWLHLRERRTSNISRYRIPVELLGIAIISLAGHLGGFLSGVNGPV